MTKEYYLSKLAANEKLITEAMAELNRLQQERMTILEEIEKVDQKARDAQNRA